MEEFKKLNFAVSGWPGSGASVLTILLAVLFSKKLYYMGNVFRHLGRIMGFSEEGSQRPAYDDYMEDIIGKTVDNYVDHILLNYEGVIVDADIGAFRLGRNPKILSVFITALPEVRIERTKLEGREGADQFLLKRDQVLREKYKELWDIDIFDPELIEKKHNIVIDNSNLSIENEVLEIINKIKEIEYLNLEDDFIESIKAQVKPLVKLFTEKGKEHCYNKLKTRRLFVKPEKIIQDMAKNFPEDVTNYPDNVKNIFLNLKNVQK